MSGVYYYSTEGLVKFTQFISGGGEFTRWGKPIYGGPFGFGEFLLIPTLQKDCGMVCCRYSVVHKESGVVFACLEETKRDALAHARNLLIKIPRETVISLLLEQKIKRQKEIAEFNRKKKESNALLIEAETLADRVRPIKKKRKAIFDASGGKCHYCHVELKIESGWHIEHKIPRSRGGTDLPDNLVASCAPCNMKKRNKTPDEFAKQMGVKL